MKNLSLLALLTLAVAPAFSADTALPVELPAVDHQVYLSELPESADLMKDATANGLTVKRLDRTSDRVVITYAYPDGHTATMGYALLSAAGPTERVVTRTVREKRVVEVADPEIIYYEPRYTRTRVVYRDPVDDFWLPLTLGLGIGWATGHHSHGWHGHARGGWHR